MNHRDTLYAASIRSAEMVREAYLEEGYKYTEHGNFDSKKALPRHTAVNSNTIVNSGHIGTSFYIRLFSHSRCTHFIIHF